MFHEDPDRFYIKYIKVEKIFRRKCWLETFSIILHYSGIEIEKIVHLVQQQPFIILKMIQNNLITSCNQMGTYRVYPTECILLGVSCRVYPTGCILLVVSYPGCILSRLYPTAVVSYRGCILPRLYPIRCILPDAYWVSIKQ